MDRQSLNELTWEGESALLDTIFAPTESYYGRIDRALEKHPYDLRATERLMNEAGYTRGADGIYASPTEGPFTFAGSSRPAGARERPAASSGWRQAGFVVREMGLTPAQDRDPEARA